MESRPQDFLPVCPYCNRSLYQQEVFQLHCCHLLCRDCIPKIQTAEGCKCFFDDIISKELHQLGQLTWLQNTVNQSNRSLEELVKVLYRELGYIQENLPCPFAQFYCQGLCGFDHSGRAKAFECPLKANCPTLSSCLFAHRETTTLPQYSVNAPYTTNPQGMGLAMSMYSTLGAGANMCGRCQQTLNFCQCGRY